MIENFPVIQTKSNFRKCVTRDLIFNRSYHARPLHGKPSFPSWNDALWNDARGKRTKSRLTFRSLKQWKVTGRNETLSVLLILVRKESEPRGKEQAVRGAKWLINNYPTKRFHLVMMCGTLAQWVNNGNLSKNHRRTDSNWTPFGAENDRCTIMENSCCGVTCRVNRFMVLRFQKVPIPWCGNRNPLESCVRPSII